MGDYTSATNSRWKIKVFSERETLQTDYHSADFTGRTARMQFAQILVSEAVRELILADTKGWLYVF